MSIALRDRRTLLQPEEWKRKKKQSSPVCAIFISLPLFNMSTSTLLGNFTEDFTLVIN